MKSSLCRRSRPLFRAHMCPKRFDFVEKWAHLNTRWSLTLSKRSHLKPKACFFFTCIHDMRQCAQSLTRLEAILEAENNVWKFTSLSCTYTVQHDVKMISHLLLCGWIIVCFVQTTMDPQNSEVFERPSSYSWKCSLIVHTCFSRATSLACFR